MAHEENTHVIEHSEECNNDQKAIQQQLTDANDEIADLKMQIAWLERSYE
jgi:hypothetical protein